MRTNDIYIHTPYRILLDKLQFIEFNKLNCEIYVDAAAIQAHKADEIKKINDTFKKWKLKKVIHGPFMDLNPGSADEGARDLAQKRMLQAIEVTKKLEAGNIVLHTGFHPIFYKRHIDEWMGRALKTFGPVAKAAEKNKIRICIENSIDDSPEVPVRLVQEIASMNVLACFDAAHYNVFSQKNVMEALKDYPPQIIGEIHISDNNGEYDDHFALGEGNIDFKAFFKELKRLKVKPIITIEPHTLEGVPKSIEYLSSI